VDDRELERFEAELVESLAVWPRPELRSRVARTVTRELTRDRHNEWLAFVGAAAAVLALLANLSWSVARGTSYSEPAPRPDDRIVAQLRELLPDMSESEARRHALVLRGAARVPDGNAMRRAGAMGITY
jgi:hypothetical protein